MSKAGFAKVDITPRVGVELCGFGPFNNRHSIAVRDRLWAKAMAVKSGDDCAIIISCDLIGLSLKQIHSVRELMKDEVAIDDANIMVHCTHTHSGPSTGLYCGWGDADYPYLELLPRWIAKAGIKAVQNLDDAEFSYAEVTCEGIGLNREYDIDAPPLEDVLKESWRPAKPELTDTTCHILKAVSKGKLLGFFSYFGCHPVVCCASSRYIHGDFVGVAGTLLEQENPCAIGLFLQGAQGDVNSCVVHKSEEESIKALDVIAERYAKNVRSGLKSAAKIEINAVKSVLKPVAFSRKLIEQDVLKEWQQEYECIFRLDDIRDDHRDIRMNTVYLKSIRNFINRLNQDDDMEPATEVQGIKLGPIVLLGAPFEIFQAIKNDIVTKAKSEIPLVMGFTCDSIGYAPDRVKAGNAGYADKTVPLIIGEFPFANIHDELVNALLDLDNILFS